MKTLFSALALLFAAATLVHAFSLRISQVADAAGEATAALPYTNNGQTENLNVMNAAIITEKDLEKVVPLQDGAGYGVKLTLSPAGERLFNAGIKNLAGKRLAIVIDGKVIAAPVLQSTSFGRELQISGSFTEHQARELAKSLSQGAR